MQSHHRSCNLVRARNFYCIITHDDNYIAHHERPGKPLETDMASRSVVMPIRIGNGGMLRTARQNGHA